MLASRVSRRAALHDGRVAHALERLSRARGTREAIAGLSREIGDLVGAETVRVLHPEQNGGALYWSNTAVSLHSRSCLAALMREAAEPLDVSPSGPLLALLPREDREWVEANAVHLIAALKRRDGEIAATVGGGEALGGEIDTRTG